MVLQNLHIFGEKHAKHMKIDFKIDFCRINLAKWEFGCLQFSRQKAAAENVRNRTELCGSVRKRAEACGTVRNGNDRKNKDLD